MLRRFGFRIAGLLFAILSLSFLTSCVEEMPPKITYTCLFTQDPIQVDGFLREDAWKKAAALQFILPVSCTEPISKTEGKLLWDKDYLYVSFKAYDKDIWSYFDKRDDATCREDVLELFIKTDPEKDPYYNFEINTLNTIYDAFVLKRGISSHRWSRWNCSGLMTGISILGTRNNWKDEDEYWSMEIAIPFSSLPTLEGKSPVCGERWLFHLARYDYSIYLPEGRELTSCAPLSKVNFHYYEDWLPLIFR